MTFKRFLEICHEEGILVDRVGGFRFQPAQTWNENLELHEASEESLREQIRAAVEFVKDLEVGKMPEVQNFLKSIQAHEKAREN